jgi:hypothetical protein
VLILTRDAAVEHLSGVTVAPITSTIRDVPSEVVLDLEDGMKRPCAGEPLGPATRARRMVSERQNSERPY